MDSLFTSIIKVAGSCGSPLTRNILDVYSQFRIDLKKNKAIDDFCLMKLCDDFMDNVIKSVALYQKGRRSSAYEFFKDAMKLISPEIKEIIKPIPHNVVLYRGRIGKEERTPQEMNHISLKKRYLVRTERYSFPGLPCLYLGDSVQVCLDELKSAKEETQIARFSTINTFNSYLYLDLACPFDYSVADIENDLHLREKFIKILPLIFCSSIKFDYPREDEEARRVSFRSEYIIPQFLLQYLIEDMDHVVGIKYRSVLHIESGWKADGSKGVPMNNFVFPAITTADVEISPLIDKLFLYGGIERE